jgi:exopolyphosphatase/guanosine-5'-triphosphate,3'-diphosphate pyrophosphatase
MRISSIDIGTNTILLLIVEAKGGNIARVLHDEQVIARLGKGVDEHRIINSETANRVAEFLYSYRGTSHKYRSEKIIAVGTSALRDASNKREFCDDMLQRTGVEIEILSGDDEAEWTYRGALGAAGSGAQIFTVLDIGGGSTEIISGISKTLSQKVSLDVGCVRLTERFLRTSPPTSHEIFECRSFIRSNLSNVDLTQSRNSRVIGVAGTLTTLAAIHLRLTHYDPSRVEGCVLEREAVGRIFDQLRMKTHEEIMRVPQISPGRADIVLAGMIILQEFMEAANLGEIAVSDRGLRYGIILRELQRNASNH